MVVMSINLDLLAYVVLACCGFSLFVAARAALEEYEWIDRFISFIIHLLLALLGSMLVSAVLTIVVTALLHLLGGAV